MPIEIIQPASTDDSVYLFVEKTYVHSAELPVLKHVASAMPSLGEGNFSVAACQGPVTLPETVSDDIVEVIVEGEGNPFVFWALTQDTEHHLESCEHCPLGRQVPNIDCALEKAWESYRLDTYRQDGMQANWESKRNSLDNRAVNQ